jgi:phosphopantothenoylcysteine decarboxylase/phosphopantothenate--cysteine ligase
MRIIVTAGPTREYIDDVRFISNASSGRMGYAVADAAAAAGHEVTLLAGPGVAQGDRFGPKGTGSATLLGGACPRSSTVAHEPTAGTGTSAAAPLRSQSPEVVRFESVDDLRAALAERFDKCDALVMTAAVGDFRPERRVAGKIPRAAGAVTVRLVPTEDILAALTAGKRSGQVVVAFAVEALPPAGAAAKAQAEMREKGADFVVVNGPEAMDAPRSRACVLGAAGVVLGWDVRSKEELGREIVRLVEEERRNREQGTRNPEKQNGSSQ